MSPSPNPSPGDPLCAGVARNDCEFLFYVKVDEDGRHAFSVTLQQQEANIAAARAAGVL